MKHPPDSILVQLSDITIPPVMQIPIKISMRFILELDQKNTCVPVLLSSDKMLLDGVKQLKAAKLLRWKTIPAIIQITEVPKEDKK